MLPQDLEWLHVRYEPPAIDFTWEREWRNHCPELSFDPGVATLVLPSEEYVDALIEDHDERETAKWYQYAEVLGQDELMQYREDYPWRVVYLGGWGRLLSGSACVRSGNGDGGVYEERQPIDPHR